MTAKCIGRQSQQSGLSPSHEVKRRWMVAIVLVAWALLLMVVSTTLMLGHTYMLPPPTDFERMQATVAQFADGRENLIIHIIYEHCTCTDSLFRHLLKRGSAKDVAELVLFVGEGDERRGAVLKGGYEYINTSSNFVQERLFIDAAPALLVFHQDKIQYAGGYYLTSATVNPQDQRIVAAVRVGAHPELLPLYGCPLSRAEQRRIDPLGLRF